MPTSHRIALGLVLATALLGAGWTLAARVQVERANRVVAIAVDYNRAQELAAMRGVTTAAVLRMLNSVGASHVAIREETLGDLISEKRVELAPEGSGVTVIPTPAVRERVMKQLAARIPAATPGDGPEACLRFPSARALDLLRPVGVGYPEEAVRDAQDARLRVVVRPIGEMAVSETAIDASLDAASAVGADALVFAGLQVLGVHELVPHVAAELRRRGIEFGYIEMAKQHGDVQLAAGMAHRIVRCHAVAAAEMVKLDPQRAVDRFALAVRERGVRLCYVRPYLLSTADPVDAAVQYVGAVAQAIRGAGYDLGIPQPFNDARVRREVLALLLAGVGAALIWLLHSVFGFSSRVFWMMVLADMALSGAFAFAAPGLAQSMGALGAAVVFPTLGLLSVQLREPGGRASLWRGLGLFVFVSLISLTGGLLAAACISDLPHMMGMALFRGTKLAQLLPLLLVLAVFLSRCTRSYEEVRTETGPTLPEWPALRAGAIEAAQAAVRYWHVALIIIGMAVGAILLLRSGNVSPIAPSSAEITVRSFLEKTLAVRPRSKEIFLGHPALILSLALLVGGWRRGLWIGILAGAIGQISLVNTFAHIHTPLLISLVRVLNGLWIGAAAAVLIWMIAGLGARLLRRPAPA